MTSRPTRRPACPNFSSGPCAKRPGWSLEGLRTDTMGRSHRSKLGKSRLAAVIETSRSLLGIPNDYVLGVVPASDTGAFEMAMWSLLGPKPVNAFSWESFSSGWVKDLRDELKVKDVRVHHAEFGELPDLTKASPDGDTVFVWNGTTSGVKVPDAGWIPRGDDTLVLCDATSAVFAMPIEWSKLDVVTWSWQKVLGGEAAHGMLALSPRAIQRLEDHRPPWPMPKIFRMLKGGKVNQGIFEGSTINTPSMLAVEDCLDALAWAESIGGLPALLERSQRNLACIETWAAERDWIDFLAKNRETRSNTSICLKLLGEDAEQVSASMCAMLENEGVAYDIKAYRDAPAGIRIWGGATVETSDIEALLPWLDWAYGQATAGARA